MVAVIAAGGLVVHEFGPVGGGEAVLGRDGDVAAAGFALVDGAFGLGAAGLGVGGDVGAVFVVEGFVFGVLVGVLIDVVEVGDGECYADADWG